MLAIVHSNRLSSFDRYICDIPNKGNILTATSSFWFNKINQDSELDIPNHFIYSIENIMIVKNRIKVLLNIVIKNTTEPRVKQKSIPEIYILMLLRYFIF